MNILLVCNKPPYPPKDGGAIAIANLANGLANNGHQVTIFAMNTVKHFVQSDALKLPSENICVRYITTDTSIKPFKLLINLLFSRLPYNAQRFINKSFQNELVNHLKENQYDIIQFEGLYVLIYCAFVKKVSQAKTIYRAHNIEHEIWQRLVKNTGQIIKLIYFKILAVRLTRFEKSLLNCYDALVPITERDNKEFNRLGNTKSSFVSPTGILNSAIRVPVRRKTRQLFFLGSLDWMPNQEGILWFLEHCWNQISKEHPNLEFHIAGRNAPISLVSLLNKKNLYFHGEIENAWRFIDSYDILIVPLFSGSGMRIKIIEAMARGKVIITTNTGAEGIGVKNNKHLMLANNSTDFVKSVNKILTDHDLFENISSNAVGFIRKNYNNDLLTRNLADFYQILIRS